MDMEVGRDEALSYIRSTHECLCPLCRQLKFEFILTEHGAFCLECETIDYLRKSSTQLVTSLG